MTRRRLPLPRWQTPLPANVAGSWGPAVIAWAQAELGITLDRWQRRAINRALATDEAGVLVHRHYLISTARQNGKTALIRALIGWALTAGVIPRWSLILGLAHDRGQARIPYTAVMSDLAPIKRRFPRGGLAITRYLGIRSDLYGVHREYQTGSRESRDAIRGLSTDLGIFDEVRTQRTYETWAALEPTTRARPEPLILAISTAGDDRAVLLRDWFDRGLRIIDGVEPADGFGMTWYAAPDDLRPDDPRAILAANPAAAEGRLPIGPIAASIRSLDSRSYLAETLNLWTEGADEWLPPGTWPERDGPQPDESSRVILGVEAVPSWRRATVTVALVTDAGVWVGVAGELDASRTATSTVSPGDLVDLVAAQVKAWKPAAVAFSAAAAASPHVTRYLEGPGLPPAVALGARQIRAASGLFRSELIGGRLTHEADPLLRQQVRAARPSGPLDGGDWYFSIRDSLGEIDAVRAAAWAVYVALVPEIVPAPPQIFL